MNHRRFIAEQRRAAQNILEHSARYTKVKNVADTSGSRLSLRSIGDAMAMLSPACSIFTLSPVIHQHTKSDLFFIHDLIQQPQGMWFHVKSLKILNASPRHRQYITITSPTHPRYSPVARLRITDAYCLPM